MLAHGVSLQTPVSWLHYSGASGEWNIMACVRGVEWKVLTNLMEAEKQKEERGNHPDKLFKGVRPVAWLPSTRPHPGKMLAYLMTALGWELSF